MAPGRRNALRVLRAVRGGELLDAAWAAVRNGLDPRERAWTHELVYGTLRLRARLDWELTAAVRAGLASLHPEVLDVLRLGTYQLREMGSVPPYAAVSESVELVRWAGQPRAAGLVNAVLQTLRRAGPRPLPDAEREPLEHLRVWGSHPEWLLRRWVARWGDDAVRRLLEANNRIPDLFLRPVGTSPAEAIGRLAAVGIAAETIAWAPDSVRLGEGADLLQALRVLPAVVQDPAASWVARYATVPRGARVLDLCAAPGGKAVAVSEQAAFVVAADRSGERLRRVAENLNRLELRGRVGAVVADARVPPFRPAEVVLLDAPCTGTGTLGRHPDGRWRVGPTALDTLASLQRDMLRAAAPLVRPGGWLVYSTCSLEPEENELQVARFLEAHPAFAADPPPHLPPEVAGADGTLYVLPQRTGTDGAFAARLRNVA